MLCWIFKLACLSNKDKRMDRQLIYIQNMLSAVKLSIGFLTAEKISQNAQNMAKNHMKIELRLQQNVGQQSA